MPVLRAPSRLPAALALALAAGCSPAPPPPVREPTPKPSASASAPAPKPDPRIAPAREVRETWFGTAIVDPYRWMEEPGSPELAVWAAAQTARARGVLDALPERAAIAARLGELAAAPRQVWGAQRWGGRSFYLAVPPGRRARALHVRDGAGAPERLVFDPLTVPGAPTGLEAFTPSIDGRLVAFRTAAGGPVRIAETTSGRIFPDTLDDAEDLAWRLDSRSFFYTRSSKQGGRVHLHVVGEDPARDRAVFGHGVAADPPIAEGSACRLVAPPGSRFVFGVVRRPGEEALAIYGAPPSAVPGEDVPWRTLVEPADQVTAFDVHGDALYLLSRKDAPRGKIVRTSLAHPAAAHAFPVIPEGDRPITSLGVARDGLFVRAGDGRHDRLVRVGFRGRGQIVETVPLPAEGAIRSIATEPLVDGALFQLAAWTGPPRWYAYDPSASGLVDARLVPPAPVAVPMLAVTDRRARAEDGASIPLALVHRGDLAPGRPVLLLAEPGAPDLTPARLTWLEHNGVLAFCAAREDVNQSLTDLLACAHRLIEDRITPSSHLAVEARGPAAAVLRRPDLFRVALIEDGVFDPLRADPSAAATSEGFHALWSRDAYHHLESPPALLLLSRGHTPRWQPAKMAARLLATPPSTPVLFVEGDPPEGAELAFLLDQLSR